MKKIYFWTAIRNCYILIISYCKYLSKLCFSLVSYPMWMHSWKRWTMYWKQTSALSFRGWAWTTLIGVFFVFQSIFWCILSVFLFSCSSLVPDFFFKSNQNHKMDKETWCSFLFFLLSQGFSSLNDTPHMVIEQTRSVVESKWLLNRCFSEIKHKS